MELEYIPESAGFERTLVLSVIPTGLLLGDDVDDVMGKGYLFGVDGGGRWPINQGFV